ncbi:MAG: endolytic transglycosylase MltG, partial [Betaproteobacteria bacterium]|nr:endolytic transglycosylase MltG [Betaproteobacteria bacterium]
LPLRTSVVELAIESGTSVRQIAEQVKTEGVEVSPSLLYWLFRLSGQARQIKAGNYEITPGVSAWQLLQKLARGEESLQAVTLIEGWTWRQWRAALDKAEFLRHDSRDLSITQIEQVRILSSLIEKETGRASDRAMISSVFHNRLRLGMPLQTDPTVIYGMGPSFDGNLRRRDLRADHPWNTYTRNGLPPTPIAMPGKGSLLAAVQPARSQALYFVARGDGSSEFSDSLEQHNRAVDRYQRLRRQAQ